MSISSDQLLPKTPIAKILTGVDSFDEAMELIGDRLPERGPYSNSRINLGCDYQFKKKYLDREKGTDRTRFGTAIGSAIHKIAEVFLKRDEEVVSQDLVDEYLRFYPKDEEHRWDLISMLEVFRARFERNEEHYIGSEFKLGCNLLMEKQDYENCWFRGIVDYVEVDEHNVARMVDFKTYPRVHSEQEINDIGRGVGAQLMGYLALLMAMVPSIEFGFYEVYYFRFGCSRTSSEKDEDGKWVRRLISREEVKTWWRMNQRKMVAMERKRKFSPTPNEKSCQYCSYVNVCPADIEEIQSFAGTADQARQVAEQLIVHKEKEKRLKDTLKNHIDESHSSIKLSNGKRVGHVKSEKTVVDVRKVLELCEEKGIDIAPYVSVSKRNIGKLIDIDQEFEEAVEVKITTRRKLT